MYDKFSIQFFFVSTFASSLAFFSPENRIFLAIKLKCSVLFLRKNIIVTNIDPEISVFFFTLTFFPDGQEKGISNCCQWQPGLNSPRFYYRSDICDDSHTARFAQYKYHSLVETFRVARALGLFSVTIFR